MDTLFSLKTTLAGLDHVPGAGARSRPGISLPRLEQALIQRLGIHSPAPEDSAWIDALRPQPFGTAWKIVERALARSLVRPGVPVHGCLGFCPVTLVISASSHDLPRFTPELFRMADPEAIVRALEANGLADDCAVAVDPQLWPTSQIAELPRSRLPGLAAHLAEAVSHDRTPTLTDHPRLDDDGEGIADSFSVAGGRILGSFLLPVIYTGESLPALPRALDGPATAAQARGFGEAASQALTLGLPEMPPLRIEAFMGAPRLIFSALFESTLAHCEFAAFWGARAALKNGYRECRITYAHAPEGQGIAVGFDPGPDIEVQIQALADTQTAVNGYALAFTRGAQAAGLASITHRTLAAVDSPDRETDHASSSLH
jgi:hypothetical protein